MNEWIKKSIELVNSPGYLDNLHEVYEMQINPERPLPDKIVPIVKEAFDKKQDEEIVKLMIKYADVFPVKDSYVGFLRANEKAIKENPLTIKRIAERLYSLGFDRMLQEATRPKETNRQLGNAFRKWSQTQLNCDVVGRNEMLASKERIVILDGGDKILKEFAKDKLGCTLKKGIDIVLKVNEKYVIGEAKFLTTPGGEQDRGFDDAHAFINEKSGKAIRIAILDGYIWLKNKKGLHDKIIRCDDNIMSALILKEFIESLK